VLGGFLLFVLLHELLYVALLQTVAIPTGTAAAAATSLDRPSSVETAAARAAAGGTQVTTAAAAAVVSLHRGPKFWGYLGRWLASTKAAYAHRHGYAYYGEWQFPDEDSSLLEHLSVWQQLPRRKMMYDKLRYLLYIMTMEEHQHPNTKKNLTYILWIDGDAVVTNPAIPIEDVVEQVQSLHDNNSDTRRHRLGNGSDSTHERRVAPWCVARSADGMGPNSGILLFHNTDTGRALLRTALHTTHSSSDYYNHVDDSNNNNNNNSTYDSGPAAAAAGTESELEFDLFTDQTSLTVAIRQNATYRDCAVLLEQDQARLLQSRVRGPAELLWHNGDFILHMPNHNRWELLRTLLRLQMS
jgi:galactosyl transferase GMA12/MNN10 family